MIKIKNGGAITNSLPVGYKIGTNGKNEKVVINEGQTFTFVNEDIIGNNEKTSISYKE